MLYEAFSWRTSAPRPDLTQLRDSPEFSKLLESWGAREGDAAVIAEMGDEAVGAAWYRYWTPERHSYGFVDAAIPEIAMAVAPSHRSQGIGRQLLGALCTVADHAGVQGLSLSVDPANFAAQLYTSAGFRKVGASGTSVTLLREL